MMRNCFTVNLRGNAITSETGISRRYGCTNQGIATWIGTPDSNVPSEVIELDPLLLADPSRCFDDRSNKTVVLWECCTDRRLADGWRLQPTDNGDDEVIVLVRSDRPIDGIELGASGISVKYGQSGLTPGGPKYEAERTYERLFRLVPGDSVELVTRGKPAYVLGAAVHRGKVANIKITNDGKVKGPDREGERLQISCVETAQWEGDAPGFRPTCLVAEIGLALWTLFFSLLLTSALFPAKVGALSGMAIALASVFVLGLWVLIDYGRVVAERKFAPGCGAPTAGA